MANFCRMQEQADNEGFVTAVTTADLREGQKLSLVLKGVKVLLMRWQGVAYAVSAVCPHAAADLSGGEFYRGKIECPDHGYCFDVRNGRTLWPEDEMVRLRCYPTKEVDGQVWVRPSKA
jgi:3-phenylpropionate/trans-cinnamate dioxygenase ferredoxin component